MNHERREFLRAQMNVFINESVDTLQKLAKTTDICERGLQYVGPVFQNDSKKGDVSIEFCLPGDPSPVTAQGKVIHLQEGEFTHRKAIEFTTLSTEDAKRIRLYVGRRKRAELFEMMRKQHLMQ